MIGFADPAVQLAERRRREARTISKLIDEAAEQSRSALSGAGVEAEVAVPITDFPSRYVQDQVAESTVWQAPESRLKDVARLAQGTSAQIARLVSSTDESWQHATSKNGGDVIYHLTAACAPRVASGQVEAASSRSVCDDALQNGLGWLRRLVVEEGQVREHDATRDLLHIYLSAWQVILFALRERSELPDDVRAAHEALMDALSDAVLADLPPDLLAEGLHRLAGWLEKEGYADLAERTRAKRENIPEPTPGFSPFSTWGWGLLGGDYHTSRGSMMGGFFDRVDAHFAG